MQWLREGPDTKATVWTDQEIWNSPGAAARIQASPARLKIAWMIEPQPLSWILDYYNLFDKVITTVRALTYFHEKFVHVPRGGCWVPWDRWGGTETKKPQTTCMIVSNKTGTKMQQLRHRIKDELGDLVDVYQNVEHKWPILAQYEYSIEIENYALTGYFTEKLIDSIASGCTPIYYGDPEIDQAFDTAGMLRFNDFDSLRDGSLYDIPVSPIAKKLNMTKAREYAMPDDRIHDLIKEWLK